MTQEHSWHTLGVGACPRPTETSEDAAVIFRMTLKIMTKPKYFSAYDLGILELTAHRDNIRQFLCYYQLLVDSEGDASCIKGFSIKRL